MTIALKKKAVETVEHVEHAVKPAKSLRRFVPTAVSQKVGRTGLIVQKNSPQILFGVGIAAGIGTVVTACHATLRLHDELDDIQRNLEDVETMRERGGIDEKKARQLRGYVKGRGLTRLTKLYAPSLALGVLSVAALTGSHHIMSRRNVALTAAYAAVEKSFEEYRERVVEKYGEEAEQEIRLDLRDRVIVEDTPNGPVKKTVKTFGTGRSPFARVWDATTARGWQNNAFSNRVFIQSQQNWANDILETRGHLFLNEVHDMLGLERSTAGQIVGWVKGHGDDFVDFGLSSRAQTDERVHEFMFGEEKSVLLDFNVDGPVYQLLDELRTNDK